MSELADRATDVAARIAELRGIFDLDGKRRRLIELDLEIAAPDLWDDPKNAASLNQEASRIRDDLSTWESLSQRARDTRELVAMVEAEPDDADDGSTSRMS